MCVGEDGTAAQYHVADCWWICNLETYFFIWLQLIPQLNYEQTNIFDRDRDRSWSLSWRQGKKSNFKLQDCLFSLSFATCVKYHLYVQYHIKELNNESKMLSLLEHFYVWNLNIDKRLWLQWQHRVDCLAEINKILCSSQSAFITTHLGFNIKLCVPIFYYTFTEVWFWWLKW